VIRGSIQPGTSLGPVHLTVRDLARSVAFYERRLGFAVREAGPGVARLGAGGPDLLVLWEHPDAPRVRGASGLYHFAVLVPSRLALARTLAHLLATRTPLTGASDHRVSEALYLADPEGNGIEIYRDRPRGEWPFEGGELRMTTDPLDVDDLLAERGERDEPWSGLAPGTSIGHVHLHVANLVDAGRFYASVLGFERMARLGQSALFLSAGGYHHHIGLNTWAGAGAPPPPAGAAGLRHFVVRLPDRAERDRIVGRARDAGVEVAEAEGEWSLRDPSANRIVLAAGDEG